MDCHDIFKRLARGTKRSKTPASTSPSLRPKLPLNIKEEDEKLQESERIQQLRQKLSISARGKDIPPPVIGFDDMFDQGMISYKLRENIRGCGYEEPTPIQMQAIPVMCSGKPILACAPTGSGKTAAFLVPVLSSLKKSTRGSGTFRVLILCPTQELSRQTYRACLQLTSGTGLQPHLIKKVKETSNFGSKYSEKFDILITTPNRLIYLLRRENDVIKFKDLKWLIIDEADKLFEDGKGGFHDQLSEIINSFQMDNVVIGMFSATFMDELAKWSRQNLQNLITVIVGKKNRTVIDVDQELIYVGHEAGKLIAFRDLVRQGLSPPVLVFVQSKERARELFSELIYDGIFVDVIHSERTSLQRENVVRAFREGKIWVLICTELMGRGIDFKGVKLVINYDFPSSVVSYIHCIGRTGRAGRLGKAITFFTNDDKTKLRAIAGSLKQAGCPIPQYMMNTKKMSKKKKERLAKTVPRRDTILTTIEYRRKKINALKRQNGDSQKNSQDHKNNFNKRRRTDKKKPKFVVSDSGSNSNTELNESTKRKNKSNQTKKGMKNKKLKTEQE